MALMPRMMKATPRKIQSRTQSVREMQVMQRPLVLIWRIQRLLASSALGWRNALMTSLRSGDSCR